jgi:hypothetical protein
MRVNGNAMSKLWEGNVLDVLDMEFGTPADKRKKAESAAVIADVATIPPKVIDELPPGVSVADIITAVPGHEPEMEGDFNQEKLDAEMEALWDDDYSDLEKPPPLRERPVITAVTGNVKYEGTKEQNKILYEARPDLRDWDRSKMSHVHPVWVESMGWKVIATFDERKIAWDALHERDEPESTVVKIYKAAQEDAAKKAIEDAQRIKDTETARKADEARKAIHVASEAERIAVAIHKAMDGITVWPGADDQMWVELKTMKRLDAGGMEYTNAVEAKFNEKYGSGSGSRANLKAWFHSDLSGTFGGMTELQKKAYAYFNY